MHFKRSLLFGASLAIVSLGACKSATLSGRAERASDIAQAGNLRAISFQAEPFVLSGYQRIKETGVPIHIYIEGDGLAWLTRTQPSMNPTPTDPLALGLAARDGHGNVVYLARPCQYSGRVDGKPCEMKYWQGARYAPEVLAAYNKVLDEIKARSGSRALHLIGYSGGGTMAALLAGMREDVASLRSVAGNLDHRTHSAVHNVSVLSASLNPPDYAQKLAGVPQYHFIGGADGIVPQSVFEAYARRLASQNCVSVKIMAGYGHTSQAWVQGWPELLALEPHCR